MEYLSEEDHTIIERCNKTRSIVKFPTRWVVIVCESRVKVQRCSEQREMFSAARIALSFATIVLLSNNEIIIRGAVVTSVSFIFETFSPYGMIRFFEFSDKGWNISVNCLKDMYQFLEGLQKASVWAVKLYDATGFYSGGAFGGDKFRLGNPTQCRELQREYLSTLRMHWNLRFNTSAVPFPVHLLATKYEIELATRFYERYTVQQSVCFPKSCNREDIDQILIANIVPSNHIVRNMTLVEIRAIDGNYNMLEDGGFYILGSIIALFLVLFTCAHFSEYWTFLDEEICDRRTCADEKDDSSLPSELTNNDVECVVEQLSKVTNTDQNTLTKFNMHHLAESMTINNINTNNVNHVNMVKVQKVKTKNIAAISLDIVAGSCDYVVRQQKKTNIEREKIVRNLLNAFSLEENFQGLTKRSHDEDEIAPVRGLQVFCSILMILAHTYTAFLYIADNETTLIAYNTNFVMFVKQHASYLVDMFFFLSGANLTHLYFKTSCQGSWGFLEQLLHFVGMIAHKICSIILPYIIALICLETSAKYFNDHSVINLPSIDFETCESNKWRNIFFIDTFFPVEERCMSWSWFISLEVQFFVAACLILLLAQIHPKYAGAICMTVFAASIVTSIIVEMDTNWITPLEKSFRTELLEFNLIFEKVWLQIPPYLLGMCLGYILYKTEGKFDMNIFIIIFGWIACILIFIGFVFGFQSVLIRVNPWIRASVLTLAHSIWSMILFWITLANISQYSGPLRNILTSKIFYAMGKLTTCVVLLGPLLVRIVILNGETGIFLSNEYFIIMFTGLCIFTYLLALILHLMFEAPLLAILKILYERHAK